MNEMPDGLLLLCVPEPAAPPPDAPDTEFLGGVLRDGTQSGVVEVRRSGVGSGKGGEGRGGTGAEGPLDAKGLLNSGDMARD